MGNSPSIYLHAGEYPDGRLAEIFIEAAKQGSFTRGMLDAFALVCSKALQFGMPLQELCDSFIDYKFEPNGYVEGDEEITNVQSILDYIFQRLRRDYLDGGTAESLVPTEPISPTEPHSVQGEFPGMASSEGSIPRSDYDPQELADARSSSGARAAS